ncbi:peptidase S8/S53 domain-containing protein [Ilyonectria destructans]|nr:peptidase S8/S53 domain-containing protein [Ilyonectria destructans]
MDLSVKIVQSLLCLIGTPFLQTPWTSEEMLVPRPGESAFGGQRLNKVYVRKEMQNASPDILAVGANTKSIILHLGVLLWELIFRKKVEITDDDVESDDEGGTISLHDVSLHNALGREYNDRNYDAASDDPAFLEIIDKCLDAFSDEELDNEKLRSTVYFTIFKPLQHYLQSHQKRIPSATLATRRLPSPSPASSRIGKRLRTEQKMNACYEQHRANYHLPRFTGSFSAPTGTIVLTANFTANESKTENESLYLDTNLDTESSSWLNRFDAANTNLATPAGSDLPRSVKIAILDTGCDIAHQFFSGPGINKADELQDRWADFLDESSEPVDGDAGRHGTALTCLLLRLAPGAKIYVIRVAKDSNGLLGARKVVAKAILHAVREWDVDIISMSFGFSDEVTSIREAITEAQRIKESRILFFAAANNNGLNGPELFPAFFESVIAVRGTSHDGTFMPQYTPKMWAHKHEVQYGTLAIDVPCGWVDNTLTKSGCSVATPIMVAIAAALISFVEHEDSLLRQRDLIRTRRGMLSVFNHMADGQPDRNQRVYLAPWQLFKDNQPPRSLVEYALSLLPQITPA